MAAAASASIEVSATAMDGCGVIQEVVSADDLPLAPVAAAVSSAVGASDESPVGTTCAATGNDAAPAAAAASSTSSITSSSTSSSSSTGVTFPIPAKAPSFPARSSSNVSHQSSASAASYNTIPTTPGRSASDAPLSVLFLSSDTGGGHRASALSLARQFELLHPGTTYQLLDVVTECMPMPAAGQYPTFGLGGSLSSTSSLDGDTNNAAAGANATGDDGEGDNVDSEVDENSDEGNDSANDNDKGGNDNDNDSANTDTKTNTEPKEGPAPNKVVGRAKSCIDELSFATEDAAGGGLPLLPPRPSPPSSGNASNATSAPPPAFKKSASAPPAFGIESFYKHLSAHPQQWRLLYHTSNSPPVRLLTDVGLKLATERTVTAKIRHLNPDVVVSVHPLMTAIPSLACAKISADTGRHLPFFTVVTDLGSGHDAWFAGARREVERIFLASDSITELAVRRGKIPRDKIVRSGLPIRHDFAVHAARMGGDAGGGLGGGGGRAAAVQDGQPYRMSIRAEKLGLCPDPDHRVVLVMGGGEGNGALSAMVDSLYVELCSRSVDATVVVVCGRNETLQEALETRDWDGLRRRGHKRAERRRKTVVLAQRVRRMLSSISTGDLRAASGTAAEEDAEASSSAVVRFEEENGVGGDGDKSANEDNAVKARPGDESPESTVDTTEKKDGGTLEDMDGSAPAEAAPGNGDDSDIDLITEGFGATCGTSLCLDARDENDCDGDDKYDAATPATPASPAGDCLSPVSSMESLAKAGSASVQVKPLGFVTNMAEYMVGADLLISKAGPGTIAEAAALGLPVLLTSYLPGQEEGNIDFVLKNEFGAYVADSDPDGVARQCSSWLRDEDKLAEMSKKATEAGVPNAAEDIARYIGQSVIRWKVHNEGI